MLYCVIHDKYFDTLNEFEKHLEEHQNAQEKHFDLTANPADKNATIAEITKEQGE